MRRSAVISLSNSRFVMFFFVRSPKFCVALASQVIQHARQCHFRLSGLEAALHRGFDPVLCFRLSHTVEEETRITAKIVSRRECDRIDPLLDYGKAKGWKAGYAMSERLDEIAECSGWQRSIDPAVAFRHLRIVILRAQQHFDRPAPAHETGKMLGGACAGDQPEPCLRLTKNCRLARSEAHVTRQHKLAAHTAHATFDLRNRDQAACTQIAKYRRKRRFAGELCCQPAILRNPSYVDMGDEIVGVGTLEQQYMDGVIGLGLLN